MTPTGKKNEKLVKKTCPTATLSTTNAMWSDIGVKLVLCGK
jgi:hypothetical protein